MRIQRIVAGLVFSLVALIAAMSVSAQEPAGRPGACTDDPDWAQVTAVRTARTGESWRFDVTLRHNDTGWDHYADEWQVIDIRTGEVYGTRVLAHPHVHEQPFTRSQSGIEIPSSVTTVLVRARCTVHGYGGCGMIVQLHRED